MWNFFARDPSKDFPYEIGEAITNDADRSRSLWTIHKAKKKVKFYNMLFIYRLFSRLYVKMYDAK